MPRDIICTPENVNFTIRNNIIKCHFVEEQSVSTEINFSNKACACNGTGMCFEFCHFFEFPSANSIISHSQHITILFISKSKLSRITSSDLDGYDFLKDLYIENCEIEYLPADLFKHTPNLEIISFSNNQIRYIDEGLLTPLKSVKYFNLLRNSCIDYSFNAFSNRGSLKELKERIQSLGKINDSANQDEIEAMKKENLSLKFCCAELEKQLKVTNEAVLGLGNQLEKSVVEVQSLKDELKEYRNNVKDMENKLKESREATKAIEKKFELLNTQVQQMDEAAKNFIVRVDRKEFKVHKRVLKAHSKVLAKLIDESPDSDILNLNDVSSDIFAEILNFMYTGNPPSDKVDSIELFASSCKMEVNLLAAIVAGILQEKVTPNNALEILVLCKKYNNFEVLKMKAFAEFAKNVPFFHIKRELASQPEKLKQILKAKLDMDKFIAEVHRSD